MILLAVVIIGVLVFFHELGHFLAAKAANMYVQEFALGMGPALISVQRGETKYSLRLLPVGGFLRVAGEETTAVGAAIPEARRYDKKTVLQRMTFVAAGSIMNFLLAALIFSFIFMSVGVPSSQPILGTVNDSWPAAQAGLQPRDRVLTIGDEAIATWSDLQRAIADSGGQPLVFVFRRGGQEMTAVVTPRRDEATNRLLVGVAPENQRFDPFTALFLGMREMAGLTAQILSVIGRMLTGRLPAEGAGPIGMVVMVGEVARTGIANLLSFAAIISIQLGLFNLLPIPALDGSKLVFLALERLRGRPVDPEKENMIHLIGFVLLMVLIVLVTFGDLRRLNIF
ncbi:MAG: Regulator of sigma-W protease RasP [Firmicutes bacterium]|nr:Regulator of sigma-W protease RasP [candidate division NPL-UPA2 bacterium]